MTTQKETQGSFADAIRTLAKFNFSAIEVYEIAINQIKNEEFKIQLQGFKKEHEQHIEKLNQLLSTHNEETVTNLDAKNLPVHNKIAITSITEDIDILRDMLASKEDIDSAYNNAESHPEIWGDAKEILRTGSSDEKRHKQWMEENAART